MKKNQSNQTQKNQITQATQTNQAAQGRRTPIDYRLNELLHEEKPKDKNNSPGQEGEKAKTCKQYQKKWTILEIQELKKMRENKIPYKTCAKKLKRTLNSIFAGIIRFEIPTNPRWSKEEDAIVLKYYAKKGCAQVHKKIPHRSINTIRARAHQLGVKRDKGIDTESKKIIIALYPFLGVSLENFFEGVYTRNQILSCAVYNGSTKLKETDYIKVLSFIPLIAMGLKKAPISFFKIIFNSLEETTHAPQ